MAMGVARGIDVFQPTTPAPQPFKTEKTVSHQTLDFEVDDGAAVVTLRGDDRAYTIDRAAAADIVDVAHRCATDRSIRAVLIRGRGKAFCVGGDIDDFLAEPDLPLTLRELTAQVHTAVSRFMRMPKPVVVAVNGVAAGGGVGLALMGDVVVASQDAYFTLAYTANGLTPDNGASWLLPRLVGLRRAAELILTPRRLSADEALDWGLVTSVVPAKELDDAAMTIVESFASGPTYALGRTKELLRRSFSQPLEGQLEDEAVAIADIVAGHDAREGMGAFRERRAPQFRGD